MRYDPITSEHTNIRTTMIVFYAVFTFIWGVTFLFHLIQLKRRNLIVL